MPCRSLPAWRSGAGAGLQESFHKALIRLTEGCVTVTLAHAALPAIEGKTTTREIVFLCLCLAASSAPFIDTGQHGAVWQRKITDRDIMKQSKRCHMQRCAFRFCTHPTRAFGLPHTSDTGLRLRLWRSAVLYTSEALLTLPKMSCTVLRHFIHHRLC